jgi:hypothetical protein
MSTIMNTTIEAEPVFKNGQRVRIKPCKNYPPTSLKGGIRYGIIQGMTSKAGMCLQNEERRSREGEWAYIVASYAAPNAGASWFSADGLEPMRRARKAKI